MVFSGKSGWTGGRAVLLRGYKLERLDDHREVRHDRLECLHYRGRLYGYECNKFYTVGEAVGCERFRIGRRFNHDRRDGRICLATSAGVKTVTFGPGTIEIDASAGNAKLDLVNNNTFYVRANATLVSGVNQLVLLGAAALNGTGNGSANTLTGNKAANILQGGAGNDLLTGGLGNDSIRRR